MGLFSQLGETMGSKIAAGVKNNVQVKEPTQVSVPLVGGVFNTLFNSTPVSTMSIAPKTEVPNNPISFDKNIHLNNATLSQAPAKVLEFGKTINGIEQPFHLDLSRYDTGKQTTMLPGITAPFSEDWWKRALEKGVNTTADIFANIHQSLENIAIGIGQNELPKNIDEVGKTKIITPAHRVAVLAGGGLAVANAIPQFAAFNVALETAKEVPQLSNIANAISKGFEYLGKGGAYGSGKFIDILPVDDQTKNELRPIAENIGGFITQYLVLHGLVKGAKTIGDVKLPGVKTDLTWNDVRDITIGKQVSPEKLSLFNNLTKSGVPFLKGLKENPITSRLPGQSVANFVMSHAQNVLTNIKKSGFGLALEEVNTDKQGKLIEGGVFSKFVQNQEKQPSTLYHGTAETENKVKGESKKYKTTLNIQDKNDLEYLGRILSEDNIKDIQAGKMVNFRGTLYEDLVKVNIISKTPQTIEQQLTGKIKAVQLKSDTFYHGTSAENARGIMQLGFKKGSELPKDTFRGGGYGKIQSSISFTETPKDASRFSTLSKDGEIVEAKLKPNSKIVSIQGVEDAVELEDYIAYLRKQKVDAVYIGGGEKELVVINPKMVTPIKSHPTNIWNKTTKTDIEAFKLNTVEQENFDRSKIQIEQGLYRVFGREIPMTVITDPSNFSNPRAIGEAVQSGIKLLEENGSLSEAVANHEGWHWFKRNLGIQDRFELDKLETEFARNNPEKIAELRKKGYKFQSDKQIAEELAADEFANYQRTGKTTFEKFRIFFEKLLERLKLLFSKRDDLIKEFKKVKNTLKNTGIVVKEQTSPSFKLKPKDYALAKKQRAQLLKEAVAGEQGALAQVKILESQNKRETINSTVLEGIKNSPYFRKEGSIKDAMGTGWLMKKEGSRYSLPSGEEKVLPARYVVVESKDVPRYTALGYSREVEIDSLAQEAGFDNGQDFLQSQLDASQAMKTTDIKKVTEQELLKDKTFAGLTQQIKETESAIAEETVPAKRLLLEQGKRDLDTQLFNERKYKIRAVQEYFGLSDQQMKKINYRDLRTMGVKEYEAYFEQVRAEAFKESELDQAKSELIDLINRKELKKTENLQKALKLPTIDKMTTAQLHQFATALEPYQTGDEFLSVRKLETLDRTDFAGAKTWREAVAMVEKKVGLAPGEAPKSDWTDRIRFDTALAEKNPFYNYLVNTVVASKLEATAVIDHLQTKINQLFGEARKGEAFINKVVPTDPKIAEYLESENKLEVASTMTPAQLEAATFVHQYYLDAYKYQIEHEGFKSSAYEGIYMPHIQRNFFEAVKDDGIKKALKEVLHTQKLEEMTQTILDQKTGKVMPFEKWFKFAQHREGGIVPTLNVAKSLLIYAKAFENKKALDSIIPEIMTSVDILTPREETPTGIKLDDTLKTFVTEYLNTRRGRPKGLIVKPGSRTDAVLLGLKAYTTFRDLSLNIPLQIGSNAGVHTSLGALMSPEQYATGIKRLNSAEGKAIVAKYENYTGRTPWAQLADQTKGLPEKAYSLMFALFQDATTRGNKIHLLGSMSPEEYAKGSITPERLAQLKIEAGRWLPIEGSASVIGSSTEGKLVNQYHTWAIPIVRTHIKNILQLTKLIKSSKFERTRAGQESIRAAVIGGVVSLILLAIGNEIKKNPDSFISKVINKGLQDAMSLFSAINPTTFLNIRTLTFLQGIATSLGQLVTLQKYTTSGAGYSKGELKGVKGLERNVLPSYLQPSTATKKTNPFTTKRTNPFKSSTTRTNPFK